MTIEKSITAMAGFFVTLSVLLAVYHNINWLWFTGFVGLNLFQSSFTGFCPAAMIFKLLGVKTEAEKAVLDK
ncbi:MAG: DUF2892 domain-containing protein [Gammaproteobacteria bacterium]|nr:DUF2892 domain-containing protein [Gammaproteobacteria bacterium]